MPTIPFREVNDRDRFAAALGALLQACQVKDGQLELLLQGYERLIRLVGRQMTDAETIREMPIWSRSDLRVKYAMVCLALSPALEHADQPDAERSWRKSDGYMRAFAKAESLHQMSVNNVGRATFYRSVSSLTGWLELIR